MIDINDLGITYTVTAKTGENKTFRIVDYRTLCSDVNFYGGSVDTMSYDIEQVKIDGNSLGFENVTWYARHTSESSIVEAIRMALKEGNEIIIIEYTDYRSFM